MERIDCTHLPGSYVLYLGGDGHLGSVKHYKPAVYKLKRLIKTKKNRYLALGGDMVETITPDDKRYDIQGHSQRLDLQIDDAIAEFKNVSDRILWWLDGNHEYKLKNSIQIGRVISNALDVRYGGYMCRAFMPSFKIFDWHGNGRINPKAGDHKQIQTNRQIALKRKLRTKADDCFIMAMHHVHQLIVHPPDYEKINMVDNGESLQQYYASGKMAFPLKDDVELIHEDYRWYVACGSFTRLFQTPTENNDEVFIPWEETVDLVPTEIGCIKITVKNDVLESVEKVFL